MQTKTERMYWKNLIPKEIVYGIKKTIIFAVTVPVMHPVRSAHGSSFFTDITILQTPLKHYAMAKRPRTIQEQKDLLKSHNIVL